MLINEIAKRANVSTRTIRYYDEMDLLKPDFVNEAGYRIYSEESLKSLFYIVRLREFGMSLQDIRSFLNEGNDRKLKLLLKVKHDAQVEIIKQKKRLETIDTFIKMFEEERVMKDFEQWKEDNLKENREKYGDELIEQYGEEEVAIYEKQYSSLTEIQFEEAKQLEDALIERIKEAMHDENSQTLLMEIGELHKRWLSYFWTKYDKKAHIGLAHLYLTDERFTAYYDKRAGDGATTILVEAIEIYCSGY